MFQAVLHLCWLNLRFPRTAQSVAPLIATNNRRLDQVEAGREFWWDDRLVRFHLAYDRDCRGTAKPIPLGEAWRQFFDGSVYVRNGFMPLAKHLRLDPDRELAGFPVVRLLASLWRIMGNVAVIVLLLTLEAIARIAVTIWRRLKGKITVTNRRIHEKLSRKIDLAIL